MKAPKWYYTEGGKTLGPFTAESIQQMAAAGVITADTLIATEGEDTWRKMDERKKDLAAGPENSPRTAVVSKAFSKLSDGVNKISGLERLEGLSFKHFFSQVFKRHGFEQMEEPFVVHNNGESSPLIGQSGGWPTPWIFSRFLLLGLLGTLVFSWALARYESPGFLPGYMVFGCFLVPIAVLTLFVEINTFIKTSLFKVICLVGGGMAVYLISYILTIWIPKPSGWSGAALCAIGHEFGRLVVLVALVRTWRNTSWILNGLMFGAASGTGFVLFENFGREIGISIGVAYYHGSLAEIQELTTVNLLASPLYHTLWTAATAGALWSVKRELPFRFSMLLNPRFLRVFAIVIALEIVYYLPRVGSGISESFRFGVFPLLQGLMVLCLIAGLIQSGMNEVLRARKEDAEIEPDVQETDLEDESNPMIESELEIDQS